MTDTHLIFIVNEHSRKGKKFTSDLHDLLNNYKQVTYDIHITEYRKHAVEIADSLSRSIGSNSLLVAVGGDGTLNEVVQGVVQSKADIPIAYIPTGSGNDFAQSRNLSKKISESIDHILSISEPTVLDVLLGQMKDGPIVAVNSTGYGIDGTVISKMKKNRNKETVGRLSYLMNVLSGYFSQKPFPVTIKTPEKDYFFEESMLVLCANQKYFAGGIPIHPLADATDGMIDLLVAEKVTFFELLSILIKIMTKESHLSHKKLHAYRATSCQVSVGKPQYGQRDGELIDPSNTTLDVTTIKLPFWL